MRILNYLSRSNLIITLFLFLYIFPNVSKSTELNLEYTNHLKIPVIEFLIGDGQNVENEHIPYLNACVSENYIATISNKGKISVFDQKGELVNKFTTSFVSFPLQFIDSKLLTLDMSKRRFDLWDIKTGKSIKSLQLSYENLFKMGEYHNPTNEIIAFVRQVAANNVRARIGYSYYFGDDLKKLGSKRITLELPPYIEHDYQVFNVSGCVLLDGRIFALQHYDSRLLEYDISGNLIHIFDPIDDFYTDFSEYVPINPTDRLDEGTAGFWDYFTSNGPLHTISNKYIIAQRNAYKPHRFIDIWDIEEGEYIGKIDIGGRYLFETIDDEIWIVDSVSSGNYVIGKYHLVVNKQEFNNLKNYNVVDPFTGETKNLASCLPKLEDTIVVLNSKPNDCSSLMYYFLDTFTKGEHQRKYKCVIIYTDANPSILISMKNSSVDWKIESVLNTDIDLHQKLPYAMIVDSNANIVKAFNNVIQFENFLNSLEK